MSLWYCLWNGERSTVLYDDLSCFLLATPVNWFCIRGLLYNAIGFSKGLYWQILALASLLVQIKFCGRQLTLPLLGGVFLLEVLLVKAHVFQVELPYFLITYLCIFLGFFGCILIHGCTTC